MACDSDKACDENEWACGTGSRDEHTGFCLWHSEANLVAIDNPQKTDEAACPRGGERRHARRHQIICVPPPIHSAVLVHADP